MEDNRLLDIDSLEEVHCAALIQSARYLEGIQRYHDQHQGTFLQRGQSGPTSHSEHDWTTQAQLSMEDPFSISKVTGPGSYRLQTLEGEEIDNSWNVDQLCHFYL